MWHSIFWHLPALVVPISLVYGATRFETSGEILREAVHWIRRLFVFLIGVGVMVHILLWLI